MKTRKIVSRIGTAAAAVSLSALMLMSSAGAWDLYYSDLAGVDPALPDRDDRVSAAAALYIGSAGSLVPMGENTILTPQMIDALNKQFDKFATNNVSILNYTFPAIKMSIKHQIYDVPDVDYTVVLTKDFLNANLGNTVNLGLDGSISGNGGILRLRNVDVGYNGSLYYIISSEDAMKLYESTGVKTNDRLLVYSVYNNEIAYADVKSRPDANLTFAMSSADHTSTGLYVTAYDSRSYEYFSRKELLPLIQAALMSDLGFSESDLENKTVKDYIDLAASEIRNAIFDGNGNARYASAEDVEKAIRDYYLGQVTVSGQTVFTAEALVHQKELTAAIMNTDTARKIIEDSIYSAFGIGISEREAQELKNALWEDLVEQTVKEMNDYENGSTARVGNINYFLSRITDEEYKNLAKEIDEVKQRFKALTGNELSLADILSTVYSYRDKLSDGVDTVTLKQVLDYINKTDAFLNGNNKTLDAVLEEWSEALRIYANTTGQSIYEAANDFTREYADQAKRDALTASQQYADQAKSDALTASQQYADQAKSDALTASQKYTDNRLLISNYELQSQLQSLKEQIEDIEDEMDDLRRENEYYRKNYYDTGDWIISSYGSVDNFINAVANEALNRMNINGRAGESAYDIAVRNGFRGTEQEWLNSLVGASAYDIAVQNGYRGSQEDWLESLRGEDGQDGADGQDGEDGRVIYIYGDQMQSAAPGYGIEDSEEPDPDAAFSGQIFADDAELDEPDDGGSSYGTVNKVTKNIPVAGNTSAPPENKVTNPKTGAAAGILIPVAAIGSLFLIRKGKRPRGRR